MNQVISYLLSARRQTVLISAFVLLVSIHSFAQTSKSFHKLTKPETWQLLDYQQDTVYGTSVNRAYKELLKGKKSQTVIVAVIDEGVDIHHEDLQGHIWTNKNEIAGNGIDDDKNGYADDIHGWNFLGGKDGRNIYATNSEADREYARLLPKFAGIKPTDASYHTKDYAYFIKVKTEHQKDSIGRNRDLYGMISVMVNNLNSEDSLLKIYIPGKDLYYTDIVAYQPHDSIANTAKKKLIEFYTQASAGARSFSLDSMIRIGRKRMVTIKVDEELYKQVKSDPLILRKDIVGDNPFDINDRNYGNNIVGDQYADHGTHCSGIISAIRDNGTGLDGVADNVLIMPVRAVNTLHYGDEMDKDIALAIRYAVDNGAQIISMSFGKDLSPQKEWVDDAVKYAEKKGVLLIHAAGNDHANIDTMPNFPSPRFLNSAYVADNMINVGSISIDTGLMLPARDSNYGQKNVDIFAPGVQIYSCIPGNQYEYLSGTSMATPVVAGIAALLMEYYPQLNYKQVKDILLRSVTPLKGKMVYKPGTKEKVDFSTLCATGGIVNAYQALQLASKMSK